MNVASRLGLPFLILIPLQADILFAEPAYDGLRSVLNPEPYREHPNDDAEMKLLKERVRLAQSIVERGFKNSRIRRHVAKEWAQLLESQLDFHTENAEKITVLKQHLEAARSFEKTAKQMFEAGAARPSDAYQAAHYRATVELQLVRAEKIRSKNSP